MKFAVISVAFITLVICLLGFKAGRTHRTEPGTYQGRTAFQWHRLAVHRRVERDHALSRAGDAIRALRSYRHLLTRRTDVKAAIRLASTAYGVDYGHMLRTAECESGLSATSKNRASTASGVFQFLDSTWASTPYGRESVWDPYANSLAAGWMMSHGRGSEWVCRG